MTSKEDLRMFMPMKDITAFELAQIFRCINLELDFNIIDFPKKLKRHFIKIGKET